MKVLFSASDSQRPFQLSGETLASSEDLPSPEGRTKGPTLPAPRWWRKAKTIRKPRDGGRGPLSCISEHHPFLILK